MPRRKPASAKQHKAEIQLKRAIKRGDVPPPVKEKNPRHKRKVLGRSAIIHGDPSQTKADALSSKRLASAFAKLSPEFLAKSKERAFNDILERPLPITAALFPALDDDQETSTKLSCPKRPKWRYDMEKKEVEKNEEGQFARWLADTDNIVEQWRLRPVESVEDQSDQSGSAGDISERSPTYFERNLEVWRQLWRVCELSQILLVLLDARCPPVHYPSSLHTYLSTLRPARKVILVLTKVDVVGIERAAAWEKWLSSKYCNNTGPGSDIKIIKTSSYIDMEGSGQIQGRIRQPHLPTDLRSELISSLQECHRELCTPPEVVRADAEKVKAWKPRVKTDVNWELGATSNTASREESIASQPGTPSIYSDKPETTSEPESLTIGLIGQPNVGKSSLLNALFGARRVKASRTPGKTKHFQTLFYNKDIRLVDCPGLVFPALVPMEMQVLSAILPISQIPSIPLCLHFALEHVPLEVIFKLTPPSPHDEISDKRTWRTERSQESEVKKVAWTTMDVLTAYSLRNGWVTARAGRPDVNRAGNALLRTLAEAKISWGFLPPNCSEVDCKRLVSVGGGIWLEHRPLMEDDDSEGDNVGDRETDDGDDVAVEEEEDPIDDECEGSESDSDDGDDNEHIATAGRFGALTLAEEEA